VPIDDGLIGGIRVSRLRRSEAADDVPDDNEAFQASTLDALLRGELRGDLTIGELLQQGDLGLGTLNLLDGELIVVDGEALVARVDGTVERVPDDAPLLQTLHHVHGAALGRLRSARWRKLGSGSGLGLAITGLVVAAAWLSWWASRCGRRENERAQSS
jgi:hypothetical protein